MDQAPSESYPDGPSMADDAAPNPVVVVMMTGPDIGAVETIVRQLLEEDLIACGNIVGGATSVYRWQGEVRRDQEALAFLKTVPGKVDQVVRRAGELHPYDVPELLVLGVESGFGPYMNWVHTETA